MKRSEIEGKLEEAKKKALGKINSAPTTAVIASFLLGGFVVYTRQWLIPVLVLLALIVLVLWIISDSEAETKPKEGEGTSEAD